MISNKFNNREVYECARCQKHFCKNCLEASLAKTKGECPLCRQDPRPVSRSLHVEAIVADIPAHCRFESLGCKVIEPRGKLNQHEDMCSFGKKLASGSSSSSSASSSLNASTGFEYFESKMNGFTEASAAFGAPKPPANSSSSLGGHDDDYEDNDGEEGFDANKDSWPCPTCTYLNSPFLTECEMCGSSNSPNVQGQPKQQQQQPKQQQSLSLSSSKLSIDSATSHNHDYNDLVHHSMAKSEASGSSKRLTSPSVSSPVLRTMDASKRQNSSTMAIHDVADDLLNGEVTISVSSKKVFTKWKSCVFSIRQDTILLWEKDRKGLNVSDPRIFPPYRKFSINKHLSMQNDISSSAPNRVVLRIMEAGTKEIAKLGFTNMSFLKEFETILDNLITIMKS